MARSTSSRLKQPNAIFELTVSGEVSYLNIAMTSFLKIALYLRQFVIRNFNLFQEQSDKIRMDFTHTELYHFYDKVY